MVLRSGDVSGGSHVQAGHVSPGSHTLPGLTSFPRPRVRSLRLREPDGDGPVDLLEGCLDLLDERDRSVGLRFDCAPRSRAMDLLRGIFEGYESPVSVSGLPESPGRVG